MSGRRSVGPLGQDGPARRQTFESQLRGCRRESTLPWPATASCSTSSAMSPEPRNAPGRAGLRRRGRRGVGVVRPGGALGALPEHRRGPRAGTVGVPRGPGRGGMPHVGSGAAPGRPRGAPGSASVRPRIAWDGPPCSQRRIAPGLAPGGRMLGRLGQCLAADFRSNDASWNSGSGGLGELGWARGFPVPAVLLLRASGPPSARRSHPRSCHGGAVATSEACAFRQSRVLELHVRAVQARHGNGAMRSDAAPVFDWRDACWWKSRQVPKA